MFASYGWLLIVFVAVCVVTLVLLPRLVRLAIARFGHRVSEPEIKLLLVVLFGLGGLATQAGSEAVLPAYVAGLVVAGVFLHDRVLMDRLRSIAFALLTPFFFLRAGTLISAPALISGAGAIAVLLLVKLAAKMIGVWPVAGPLSRYAMYVTYTRGMTENALPLPYEVQEMTTTEARKRLPDLVNMAAFGHVTTVLVRDGRRLARIVPEEDAWVYSPAWQDGLREAEADMAAGRVRRFDTDDDFLTHLDDLDDEAGG